MAIKTQSHHAQYMDHRKDKSSGRTVYRYEISNVVGGVRACLGNIETMEHPLRVWNSDLGTEVSRPFVLALASNPLGTHATKFEFEVKLVDPETSRYEKTMDGLDKLDDKLGLRITLTNMPDIFLHCHTCSDSWTNHDPTTARIAINNDHRGHDVTYEWGGFVKR